MSSVKWEDKYIDLGDIFENEKHTLIFKAKQDLKIINIETSCGCTKAEYEKRQLIVNFKSNSVPQHLRQEGSYQTLKTITLLYADGKKDKLSFGAKVLKK